jgi:aminoacrylate peracid reductase
MWLATCPATARVLPLDLLRLTGNEADMPKRTIIPPKSAPPLAPYSPGVLANGILYVSGVLAMDADGETIGLGDAAAQTWAVLNAIKSVVTAAGGTMADITFNSIFLKDLADYQRMNEVYKEFFPGEYPARFCIRADLVRPEFLVEISSIAHIDKHQ